MYTLNRIFMIGNLTRDPELKFTQAGTAVTNFSIAVNRSWKKQNGERQEETTFVRIITWRKLAEICNEYLKKGSTILVEGRLSNRSWTTQDGQKRSTIEVIANNIQFINIPRRNKEEEPPAEDAIVDETSNDNSGNNIENAEYNESDSNDDVPF
ncbi:single-stranded DNA-binding protein [Candidatus Dependentiae bacterium]|nr:single-stranded DNA-binding protein [Candidatus Dependentiae bacterium]